VSYPRISDERLATVRQILAGGGTLQQAADAIGVTKPRLWRLARHYNLPRRTYQTDGRRRTVADTRTLAKQRWWAERDPQAVA
jgi:hypothetical protein